MLEAEDRSLEMLKAEDRSLGTFKAEDRSQRIFKAEDRSLSMFKAEDRSLKSIMHSKPFLLKSTRRIISQFAPANMAGLKGSTSAWPANMAGEHGRRTWPATSLRHHWRINLGAQVHECARMCTCVCVCVRKQAYIYIYIYIYMRVRIYACKCICVRLRMHVNLHAYGQFLGHQKISGLRVGKWQLSTPHRKNCQSTRPCSPHPPL